MDKQPQLILIADKDTGLFYDKTASIVSCQFREGRWHICYTSAPNRPYAYTSSRVQVLALQQTLDGRDHLVFVDGKQLFDVEKILDFGLWIQLQFSSKPSQSYPEEQVHLQKNCLADADNRDIFQYFADTAAAISLTVGDFNILAYQYGQVQSVSPDTVLAKYLSPKTEPEAYPLPEPVLYPFGLNQSQKAAVERALSSQVSIIQGPPGTGKTQTILNILANALHRGQTAAVVSSNNSATHNVVEKLEKKGLGFLTAFLGNAENKEAFLQAQTGRYPDMGDWLLPEEERQKLAQDTAQLSRELNEMLNAKNRIAAIEQELLQLTPEQQYFDDYYAAQPQLQTPELRGLNSTQVLALWLEFEHYAAPAHRFGLFQKLGILFHFNYRALQMFRQAPEMVIPYLQHQFYVLRKAELNAEKEALQKKLGDYAFDAKMKQLEQLSLQLFRAELADRYPWQSDRPLFKKRDFRQDSARLAAEYPIILSTTYSIKGTLSPDFLYDVLIIDESSQVDLATGVLAMACARSIVIVGDLQQLSSPLLEKCASICGPIWLQYQLDERYHFTAHNLLSSALAIWPQAPVTLLREHYRCHPKIINFCNEKFYGGQLIIMTEDHGEPDVLKMITIPTGRHGSVHAIIDENGDKKPLHINTREIDIIEQEVLPHLRQQDPAEIGIIAPYRDQVDAMSARFGPAYSIATVHKFQGREKDTIVLSSVDDVISSFNDRPELLNVAVSRAVRSLTVIMSSDPRNDHTNYGDLARYIRYNSFSVVPTRVYSVFDLLYRDYARQRRLYLKKHRRVSQEPSENLLYALLEDILQQPRFSMVSCAVHVGLATLIRDFSILTEEECRFGHRSGAHVDFLLYHKMDKQPLLAIEVDGTTSHLSGSRQAERDRLKDSILQKCGLPLLRLPTHGSGEREKINTALGKILQ